VTDPPAAKDERRLRIGDRLISDESDCYVIAEIGHNHQGDPEKAKQLFAKAKECGVDAVKLQKRDNRSLFTTAMYNKPYDHENSFGRTYGEHREFLEFGREEYIELQRYAGELGLGFFASAFDVPSADFLAGIGVPAFKIASGDLKNLPLLKHVARYGKPMLVSTGGGTLEDVRRVYGVVQPINPRLCFLQCTASYPTAPEEMNLRVIATFREAFPDVVVGLSDHFNGIAMGTIAYMLGARVIEKHFTLNHTWKGTDHAFSLEPIGMQKMVRDLRRARVALGDGVKRPLASELPPLVKMGKKLVAGRDLPAGHLLTEDNIAIKSPGDGLPPTELESVLGRRLLAPLKCDEDIRYDILDGAGDKAAS
jgi:N-acetylneuraminate synthase/sialic acid synthase